MPKWELYHAATVLTIIWAFSWEKVKVFLTVIVLLLVVSSAQLGDPEKIMQNSNNKIQHRSNKAENRLTLKSTRHADTISSEGKRRKQKIGAYWG